MLRTIMGTTRSGLMLGMVLGAAMCGSGTIGAAELEPVRTPPSAFLFQVAMEFHDAGRDADAISELTKVLLINPDYPGASDQLLELSQRLALRETVIDAALDRLTAALPPPAAPSVTSE